MSTSGSYAVLKDMTLVQVEANIGDGNVKLSTDPGYIDLIVTIAQTSTNDAFVLIPMKRPVLAGSYLYSQAKMTLTFES